MTVYNDRLRRIYLGLFWKRNADIIYEHVFPSLALLASGKRCKYELKQYIEKYFRSKKAVYSEIQHLLLLINRVFSSKYFSISDIFYVIFVMQTRNNSIWNIPQQLLHVKAT